MASHSHPSYLKIYIMLLVLFVISVAGPEIADIMKLEGATRLILVLITAFGIALVKAYYVLAYFMHLKFEKIYAPYILLSMVALLFVFFFGTATDAMKSEGHNWEKTPIVLPEDKGFDHHDDHGDHSHDDHSGHDH
ncbi:cytochrome C oxidase subunit IV family protein [Pelagicoccus mobilis]|uniref:Cytochrome C oxidase subunit IV family protein n=1 Tax=Pelagicoccus mobilis TaxID=415221 RepID=A0A934VS21_9BACT|nr:cytochrome C oxidase subunit IV family protein [Pelagicoccus mobilis]MBK1878555.1 cytochrome C oxidase subunit IV family protein [Pelagicoccus mobilis]